MSIPSVITFIFIPSLIPTTSYLCILLITLPFFQIISGSVAISDTLCITLLASHDSGNTDLPDFPGHKCPPPVSSHKEYGLF